MKGANETDPDFNTKLELAKYCFNSSAARPADSCFAEMNAPHLDLELFTMGQCIIDSAFTQAIANTITIKAQAYYIDNYSSEIEVDNIHNIVHSLFEGCVAKKVTIIKTIPGDKSVYYYLAAIQGSNVECFEFKDTHPNNALDINIVADKILPDVTQDEHKPKLIFHNVLGTITTELKQRMLDKGYPSVEFYDQYGGEIIV